MKMQKNFDINGLGKETKEDGTEYKG